MTDRIHIVGIGGAGMSGIARVLNARGVQVSGSDAKDSRRLQSLAPLGVHVFVGHSETNMLIDGQPPTSLVISTAVSEDNVEVKWAREHGIPVLSRATQLAELLVGYQTISVAGTHGKTTTTSMVTVALQHAAADPSFVIGSEINESGSNAHQGTGKQFVVEADESDGTFLVIPTSVGIVTNVEPDHLNYWGTFDAIKQGFEDFVVGASQSPDGFSVVCGDDAGAREIADRSIARGASVITYGYEASNDAVVALVPSDSVGARFTVTVNGETYGPIQLRVPGQHNALNATAAFLAVLNLGFAADVVIAGLEAFTGTHRRFEFRGSSAGIRVFDDYAHHPTEIDAVLKAARSVVGNGRVLAAFQAHHYYRTALFAREFGEALGLADFVVVLEVFAPGETPIPGASGSTMAGFVPLEQSQVVFEPSWSAVPAHLAKQAAPGDIIMTLGAGDIGMMCPEILTLLDARTDLDDHRSDSIASDRA